MNDGQGERKRKETVLEDLPTSKGKSRKGGGHGNKLNAAEMELPQEVPRVAPQDVPGAEFAAQESKHDNNTCASTGVEAFAATSSLVQSVNVALAQCLADPPKRDATLPKVSVIIPCHNAMPWLSDCLKSCCVQDYCGPLEVSVHNDASTDDSLACIKSWEATLTQLSISLIHSTHSIEAEDAAARLDGGKGEEARRHAGGAGRARNIAIRQSSGRYLCFLDADDVMAPSRITRQLEAAVQNPHAIVGGGFVREPADATEHYARWCNGMEPLQLVVEQYREITVILPTWFFSRELFERVGGFEEVTGAVGAVHGVGGGAGRATVHQWLHAEVNSAIGLRLSGYARATGARPGSDGAGHWCGPCRWGRSELSEAGAARVGALCDVDENKIGKEYFNHRSKNPNPPRIPIIHFTEAKGPVVVCVSKRRFSDDLDAELIRNVATLGLTEGHDLWFFV